MHPYHGEIVPVFHWPTCSTVGIAFLLKKDKKVRLQMIGEVMHFLP